MAFAFKKTNYISIGRGREEKEEEKQAATLVIPEGMWMKCANCGETAINLPILRIQTIFFYL